MTRELLAASAARPERRRPGRETALAPAAPVRALQRALGNRQFGELLQSRLAVAPAGGAAEREADGVASAVMRSPASDAPTIQRQAEGGAPMPPEVAARIDGLRGRGQPLGAAERAFFEPRLGRDLGDVRVHAGAEAAGAARALGARAFTLGSDVAFAAGEHAPGTERGLRLMAHELAHTVQQGAAGAPVVQRQPKDSAAPAEMGANEIFPFRPGSRVLLGQLLESPHKELVEQFARETSDALRAIDAKEAKVTSATADLFEAVIAGPITLPKSGDQPEQTLRDITVRLARSGGTFDFSMTAKKGDPPVATTLDSRSGLTASREGGAIVLSSGSGSSRTPELKVTPGKKEDVDIAVYTAPLLKAMKQIPDWAAALAPARLNVINIRQLEDAATKSEVQEMVQDTAARRTAGAPRNQQVEAGVGLHAAGGRYAPWLAVGWQARLPFPKVDALKPFLNVPLELRLQYAPDAGVLAGIYSGVGARLPTRVPVNVSIVTGIAGGQIELPAGEGTETQRAFGVPLGIGAGVELGRWRVGLRYEHLFNFVAPEGKEARDVNAVGLTAGRGF